MSGSGVSRNVNDDEAKLKQRRPKATSWVVGVD